MAKHIHYVKNEDTDSNVASLNKTRNSTRLGYHRGKRRIYMQGRHLVDKGLSEGMLYDVALNPETKSVVIKLTEKTPKDVALKDETESPVIKLNEKGPKKVSGKKASGCSSRVPVIDVAINPELLDDIIPNDVDRVTVEFTDDGIVFTAHHVDRKCEERIKRTIDKLNRNLPLDHGELAAGAGIMADALHKGFSMSGVSLQTSFVVEKNGAYLQQLLKNRDLIGNDTLAIEGGMEDVDLDILPVVDILSAGIPCTAESVAAKSKKGQLIPEYDPDVGHLFMDFLMVLRKVNPSIVVLENVPTYKDSLSGHLIRSKLKLWGYDIHERILSHEEAQTLERRKRYVLVAVTKGLMFDWNTLAPVRSCEASLGNILEQVPDDSPKWTPKKGLKNKMVRDKAKGSGFSMQLYTPESTYINTLRAGYQKSGSSDPLLIHPNKEGYFRILTGAEHARCKAIPERLFDGITSDGLIHQICGQSVLHSLFVSIGRALGSCLSLGNAAKKAASDVVAAIPSLNSQGDLNQAPTDNEGRVQLPLF